MLDKYGRTITIDNYKGTKTYEKWKVLNEKAAKARKGKSFFAGMGLNK